MGGCIKHLGRLCKAGAHENFGDDRCSLFLVVSEAIPEALGKAGEGTGSPGDCPQGQCPQDFGIQALEGYPDEAFSDPDTLSGKGESLNAAADGLAGQRMDIFRDRKKRGGGHG